MPKQQPFKLSQRNSRPIKTEGNVNGPVNVYYLSQEELAPYRQLRPPTDSDGKKLRRAINGGGIA